MQVDKQLPIIHLHCSSVDVVEAISLVQAFKRVQSGTQRQDTVNAQSPLLEPTVLWFHTTVLSNSASVQDSQLMQLENQGLSIMLPPNFASAREEPSLTLVLKHYLLLLQILLKIDALALPQIPIINRQNTFSIQAMAYVNARKVISRTHKSSSTYLLQLQAIANALLHQIWTILRPQNCVNAPAAIS